jgi:hypothetical protein
MAFRYHSAQVAQYRQLVARLGEILDGGLDQVVAAANDEIGYARQLAETARDAAAALAAAVPRKHSQSELRTMVGTAHAAARYYLDIAEAMNGVARDFGQ